MFNYMGQNWGGGAWGPGMMGGGWAGIFLFPLVLLFIVWTVYWKYHALWHAAKEDEKWWFLGLLVINTLGILEILYLYYFSNKPMKHNEKNVPMVPPQSGM